MNQVMVNAGSVKIPPICVACGSAANAVTDPKSDSTLAVSGSSQSGNKVRTASLAFPLCPECAAARTRAKARKYPVSWPSRVLLLASAACGIAFFVAVNVEKGGGPSIAGWMFAAAIVALIAGQVLKGHAHEAYDKSNPPSDDDRRRLDLIAGAAHIYPDVGSTAVSIALANETFRQTFEALNPMDFTKFIVR